MLAEPTHAYDPATHTIHSVGPFSGAAAGAMV